MDLWKDGRTPPAGCLAGNLVLAHLRDAEGEQFTERKGTTFRGRAGIWVGRMCSTDSYLYGRDRHWANLSLEQHREVTHEAALEGGIVKYLFITALAGHVSIHFWIIPSEIVEKVAFCDPRQAADYVYSLHIREESEGKFVLEGTDVTQYHRIFAPGAAAMSRLERAFETDAAARQRRQDKKTEMLAAARHERSSDRLASNLTRGHFQIPLKGGRSAILEVPLPAVDVDLVRIKGWIDLMNDVLTEPLPPEATVEARRERALDAVRELQAESASNKRDQLSSRQIDDEIRRVRRERK